MVLALLAGVTVIELAGAISLSKIKQQADSGIETFGIFLCIHTICRQSSTINIVLVQLFLVMSQDGLVD